MSDLVPFLNEILEDEEISAMKKEFDSFTKKLDHSRDVKVMCGNNSVLWQGNVEQIETLPRHLKEFVAFRPKKDKQVFQNIHPKEIKDFRLLIGGVQVGGTMNLIIGPGLFDLSRSVEKDGHRFAVLSDRYGYDRQGNLSVLVSVGPFSKNEDFDAFLLGDISWAGPFKEDKTASRPEGFGVFFHCFLLRTLHFFERNDVRDAKSRLEITKSLSNPFIPKALVSTKCPPSILLDAAPCIRDIMKRDLKLEIEALKKSVVASRTMTITLACTDSDLETLESAVGRFRCLITNHLFDRRDSFFKVSLREFPMLSFSAEPSIMCDIAVGGIDMMQLKTEMKRKIGFYKAAEGNGEEDGWYTAGFADHNDLFLIVKVRAIVNERKDKIKAPKADQIHDVITMNFQTFLEKHGMMEENRANFELLFETIYISKNRFRGLLEFTEVEDDITHCTNNDTMPKKDD